MQSRNTFCVIDPATETPAAPSPLFFDASFEILIRYGELLPSGIPLSCHDDRRSEGQTVLQKMAVEPDSGDEERATSHLAGQPRLIATVSLQHRDAGDHAFQSDLFPVSHFMQCFESIIFISKRKVFQKVSDAFDADKFQRFRLFGADSAYFRYRNETEISHGQPAP